MIMIDDKLSIHERSVQAQNLRYNPGTCGASMLPPQPAPANHTFSTRLADEPIRQNNTNDVKSRSHKSSLENSTNNAPTINMLPPLPKAMPILSQQLPPKDIPSSPRTFSSPDATIFSDDRNYPSPVQSSPAHLEEIAAGALEVSHATSSKTVCNDLTPLHKEIKPFYTGSFTHTVFSSPSAYAYVAEPHDAPNSDKSSTFPSFVEVLAPIQLKSPRVGSVSGTHTLPPMTDITDNLPPLHNCAPLSFSLPTHSPPRASTYSHQMAPPHKNAKSSTSNIHTDIFGPGSIHSSPTHSSMPPTGLTYPNYNRRSSSLSLAVALPTQRQSQLFPNQPTDTSQTIAQSISQPSTQPIAPPAPAPSITSQMSIQTLTHPLYPCHHAACTTPPFQTQYLLNSHLKVHSLDRPHFCGVAGCKRSVRGVDGHGGVGFKRKNEMIRHGLVHRSPGYVCPFCKGVGHVYPRPDNLQRHVKAHHADKSKDDLELKEVLSQRPGGGGIGRKKKMVAESND